jgi:hypothetical protein
VTLRSTNSVLQSHHTIEEDITAALTLRDACRRRSCALGEALLDLCVNLGDTRCVL